MGNVKKEQMLLYAVTDRSWLDGRTLSQVIEEAVQAGVTFVQIREKTLSREEFLLEAKNVKQVTDRYRIPFVVNDDVLLAKEIDADGVHIGQQDTVLAEARALLGADKIIGVSARTVEQAQEAEKNGADYLGVGAVFPTGTKTNAVDITLERLKEITEAVSIPVVAIGGINEENVMQLKGGGMDGIAVVSAVFAAEHPGEAAKRLRAVSEEICKKA